MNFRNVISEQNLPQQEIARKAKKRRLNLFDNSNSNVTTSIFQSKIKKDKKKLNTENKNSLKKMSSNLDSFNTNDTGLMSKTPIELEEELRVKRGQLREFENKYNTLANNDGNITFIEKNLKELDDKIQKENDNDFNLRGELRLLNEECLRMSEQKIGLNTKIRSLPLTSEYEKSSKLKLIKNIRKKKKALNELESKFDQFYILNRDKLEKIRQNSEKNMNIELEAKKMDVLNYDADLKNWLSYFNEKIKSQ